MAFVPHVPRQTASPEAQDLANRITALIQEYQRNHPDLSERDVRDAMEAAAGGDRRPDRRMVAIVGGLAAALIGAATFLQQRGAGALDVFPVVAVAIVVALLAAVFARRRS